MTQQRSVATTSRHASMCPSNSCTSRVSASIPSSGRRGMDWTVSVNVSEKFRLGAREVRTLQ
eukprot:scaffold104976_cov69-Phaeocystis_antarctica.AAC.1